MSLPAIAREYQAIYRRGACRTPVNAEEDHKSGGTLVGKAKGAGPRTVNATFKRLAARTMRYGSRFINARI